MRKAASVTLRVTTVFACTVISASASAEISLALKKSFIEKYKDRATIEASCLVDHTKWKLNPASKDGDMHIVVAVYDQECESD